MVISCSAYKCTNRFKICRETGENITFHKCLKCFKLFDRQFNLNRHLSTIHELPQEIRPKPFSCDLCNRHFSSKGNVYRHITKHFPEMAPKDKIKPFHCDICWRPFSLLPTLNYHMRSKHAQKSKKRSRNIVCTECQKACTTYTNLEKHLEDNHGFKPEIDERFFSSMKEFIEFKVELEEVQQSSFVVRTSNSVFAMYVCHRVRYYDVGNGNSGSKIKWNKTEKINGTCPARIIVNRNKSKDDTIRVVIQRKHVGHECAVKSLKLSECEKAMVASKIAAGLSAGRILKDVRESVSEDGGLRRFHLLDKTDMRNITKQYSLDCFKPNSVIDNFIPSQWGKCSPVIFYKRRGEHHELLQRDDFVLVLMSHYCKVVEPANDIMISAANDTKGLSLQLITLFAINNYGAAAPLAVCLSSQVNSPTLTTFLAAVKKSVGAYSPEILRCNPDSVHWNVWTTVMNKPSRRMPCVWHIDKDWTASLNRILRPYSADDVLQCSDSLTQAIRRLMVDATIKAVKNTPTFRMRKISKSHRESVKLPQNLIVQIREAEWMVDSETEGQGPYNVCKVESSCTKCQLTCPLCNVCVHQFSCTCFDYTKRFNLCKHAHACEKSLKFNENADMSMASEANEVSITSSALELAEVVVECTPQLDLLISNMNNSGNTLLEPTEHDRVEEGSSTFDDSVQYLETENNPDVEFDEVEENKDESVMLDDFACVNDATECNEMLDNAPKGDLENVKSELKRLLDLKIARLSEEECLKWKEELLNESPVETYERELPLSTCYENTVVRPEISNKKRNILVERGRFEHISDCDSTTIVTVSKNKFGESTLKYYKFLGS